MFGNVKSLAYYESNKEDPYITLQDDEEDEEREDLQVLATDNLILSAKVEDELAHLEVYVYEDESDNLYVHHDIMLPAIPLRRVAGHSCQQLWKRSQGWQGQLCRRRHHGPGY